MSTPTLPSWAHELSFHYKRPLADIRALLKLGVLPPESARTKAENNMTWRLWADEPMIAKLEAIRPRFDTPVAPFLTDLHDLGALLAAGIPDAQHKQTLVEFRCFSFGRIDAAYPITVHGMPWGFRRHRVAVTRAELCAAGYPEFKRQWNSGEPFNCVPIGGEIPIGPFEWVYNGKRRPQLCRSRGEFLLRLAKVLEATR
jgi:hypothetical protein